MAILWCRGIGLGRPIGIMRETFSVLSIAVEQSSKLELTANTNGLTINLVEHCVAPSKSISGEVSISQGQAANRPGFQENWREIDID